jgi:transposase-like protein
VGLVNKKIQPMRINNFTINCLIREVDNQSFLQNLFEIAGYCERRGSGCDVCGIGPLYLLKVKRGPLGFIYKCSNRLCKLETSVVKNTLFSRSCIKKVFIILGYFIKNKTISSIVEDSGYDEKTVYKYFNKFRELCANYESLNVILGGDGCEVEIDETHLFKRKFHRGRILTFENVWILGIFERNTKRIYVEHVLQRDSETLFNIVSEHVMPGTIIFTDSWKGYSKIKRFFETKSVKHRLYFVDPLDSNNHTNNIERTWRTLKDNLRGVSI